MDFLYSFYIDYAYYIEQPPSYYERIAGKIDYKWSICIKNLRIKKILAFFSAYIFYDRGMYATRNATQNLKSLDVSCSVQGSTPLGSTISPP